MRSIKEGTWLHDLIEVYNELGGQASYANVYPLAKRRRLSRGASWTPEAEASIRRTVEDHAESSKNFRGRSVFYSVNGHGRGVWALMPEYLITQTLQRIEHTSAYIEGIEGIVRERYYLQRSRDPRLVQARKEIDAFSCQACGFCLAIGNEKYIIDVHHLNRMAPVRAVCADCANGRKALPYGMRFSCFTDGDLHRR